MQPHLKYFTTHYPPSAGYASPDSTRKVAYVEWGDDTNPRVLICVHGMTQNSRDFDRIAEFLAPSYRVICPDIVGRGQSDWLQDPTHYHFGTYVEDMAQLLTHLAVKEVDWLGTSMGGLIGMFLAEKMPGVIRYLILNDVGPYIAATSLQRLAVEVSDIPELPDLDSAETYLRQSYAGFGIQSDENWHHLTTHNFVLQPNGKYRLHFDPALITSTFQTDVSQIQAFEMWEMWNRLQVKDVLCLRGALSDILLAETAEQMTHTGPEAQLITFPNIGHPPGLMEPDQVQAISNWLLQHKPH